jgi:Domain of unknown function (DUF4202)
MTRKDMLEEVDLLCDVAQNRGSIAAAIAREFPSIYVGFGKEVPEGPRLHASEWETPQFDWWQFDSALDDCNDAPFVLHLIDDRGRGPAFPIEVLNRSQRLIARRNDHSQTRLFERAFSAHRLEHDLSKPLVRADYRHALDVWQWTLRVDPAASLPLQLAALFHDIERLVSEPDRRIEHHAADYQQFKNDHAREGGRLAASTLEKIGAPPHVVREVAALIAGHEEGTGSVLSDADALSFFSLNSGGYADYFGPAQTRVKIAWTWKRMRPAARGRMETIRLRPDVATMLAEAKETDAVIAAAN